MKRDKEACIPWYSGMKIPVMKFLLALNVMKIKVFHAA